MPSLRCCSIILFLLALAPSISHAQQPEKKLKDLKRVIIVIENLGNEEKGLGLSTDELNAVAVVALKRDLPSLRIDQDAHAMFYVRVTAVQISCGYAVHVEVSLDRWVAVIGEDGTEVTRIVATIWERGRELAGPANGMSSRIYECIREQATKLAADYYQQNEH
jgi:hypothetical protein